MRRDDIVVDGFEMEEGSRKLRGRQNFKHHVVICILACLGKFVPHIPLYPYWPVYPLRGNHQCVDLYEI